MLAILASNCAHGYSSEACAGVSAASLLLTPTIPQACALPLQASWHSRGLAIASARKRNIALHVRLLACTVLIPLEAALERLLTNAFPALVPNLHVALYAALFSMEAICVALIVAEWRTGRVRWPLPALLTCYVVMHVTATPIAALPAFQQFCTWFARLSF